MIKKQYTSGENLAEYRFHVYEISAITPINREVHFLPEDSVKRKIDI